MEKQSTPTPSEQPTTPPPESDADTNSPPHHGVTTPHSLNSGHISLSPDHSPASSSLISISHRSSPENKQPISPEKLETPATVYRHVKEQPAALVNRVVLEEPVAVVTKTDNERRRVSGVSFANSITRRGDREKVVKRVGLGFRVLGFVFCLVSFAVMAADRDQGWALDSFHRYIEFRYCIAVNVIAFLYSGAQALDLSYNLVTGKYGVQGRWRCYLDFAVDQIVAYLLISASSSAAIRIDDWQSNWGKDKFPDMATASVAMSFLAFVALACSSLISGYALCTSKHL